MFFEQFPKTRNIHCPLPINKRKMTIKKSSLRHWEEIPSFFLIPLPIFFNGKQKLHQELCAPLPMRFPTGNYCTFTRRYCNFKGLSREGERGNSLKISVPLPSTKNVQIKTLFARSISKGGQCL